MEHLKRLSHQQLFRFGCRGQCMWFSTKGFLSQLQLMRCLKVIEVEKFIKWKLQGGQWRDNCRTSIRGAWHERALTGQCGRWLQKHTGTFSGTRPVVSSWSLSEDPSTGDSSLVVKTRFAITSAWPPSPAGVNLLGPTLSALPPGWDAWEVRATSLGSFRLSP